MEIMKKMSHWGSVPGDAVSSINLDLPLGGEGWRGEGNYNEVNWKNYGEVIIGHNCIGESP